MITETLKQPYYNADDICLAFDMDLKAGVFGMTEAEALAVKPTELVELAYTVTSGYVLINRKRIGYLDSTVATLFPDPAGNHTVFAMLADYEARLQARGVLHRLYNESESKPTLREQAAKADTWFSDVQMRYLGIPT